MAILGLMFPLAFALMLLGAYFKKVEYLAYNDRLVFRTHLLVSGGEVIPFENIISVESDKKERNIIVRYRVEVSNYDDVEENRERVPSSRYQKKLKIESNAENLNEDKEQLSKLVREYLDTKQ